MTLALTEGTSMMFTRVVTILIVAAAPVAFTAAGGLAYRAVAESGLDHGPAESPAAPELRETPPPGQPSAEEHAGHGAADINPVSPDKFKDYGSWEKLKEDLAVWTGVVFLLLLLVLWKLAWGPIASGLAKREQGIADEIASAKRTNEEARSLLEEYQQKLAQSGDEVRQMLDEAKRDAQNVGQQIIDAAKREAQAEHQRALAEIELATSDALKELAEQSAGLAVELAGKIVDARLDPAAHTRLIEQAVARFSGTAPESN